MGKRLGVPLYALLGLDPSRTPHTSFTIGIADPETTLRKLAEIGDHPVLKVKLGLGTAREQIETIEAIRDRYTGTIRIDANEGWSVDRAIPILNELARYDIEFCEQPIPAGSPHGLRAIRERSKIPIVTDEDSLDARDLPALIGCVDGVNVKLAKTGGIRGALAMIATARALGFKVMLGCMVESAIAVDRRGSSFAAGRLGRHRWAVPHRRRSIHRRPVRSRQARAAERPGSRRARARRRMRRRYAILAPGQFADDAKTAHGVIAYGSDETVAVIDPEHAGKRVRDVLPYLRSDAPIVASVAEALRYEPTALLIGTAPRGGALPADWRAEILAAIAAKIEIVSGLHDMLGEDQEFKFAAQRAGVRIWDVREPPDTPLFSGAVYRVTAPTLLLVGNDCAVGKMTVALELCRAAAARRQARELRADRTDRHHDRRAGASRSIA